jgi:hypothetical protein
MTRKENRSHVNFPQGITKGKFKMGELLVTPILVLLALFIALLSVFGLYPNKLPYSFRYIPIIRFLLRANQGIKKLKSLNDLRAKDQRMGILSEGEVGFQELVNVIKDNTILNEPIKLIRLEEHKAGVLIGNISPDVVRVLIIVQGDTVKSMKTTIIKTDPFEPDKPVSELRRWVEDVYRKKLAVLSIVLIALWLVSNFYVIWIIWH